MLTDSLSPEPGAGRILTDGQRVDRVIEPAPTGRPGPDCRPTPAQRVEDKLIQRRTAGTSAPTRSRAAWSTSARRTANQITSPLLISPENRVTTANEKVFVVANSMREVQPEINVLVSPSPERLAAKEPVDAPAWTFPAQERR